MSTTSSRTLLAVVILLLACAAPRLQANEESERLRLRAFDLAYNLDRKEALATLRQAQAADPADPGVYRAIASVTWLDVLFRRGVVTVDDYLGRMTSKGTLPVDRPPAELAERFQENVTRALAIAEQQVRANPNGAAAHYDVGAAVGLEASWKATAEGQVLGGLRAARRAYAEHERVLELDPARKDAGLIAGTYRYIVSQLPLPLRWMAYLVGFGGGREHGLRLIEEAAAYPSDVQPDALFALVLLYNREQRYAEAIRVLEELQKRFPRNRLLWLEQGATALRGNQLDAADAALSEGIRRLALDTRPRAFGEEALWWYKRGAARVRLGRYAEADHDLRAALAAEGRDWVHGRVHTELGKLADVGGDRARARQEYRQAAALADKDNDPTGEAEARRLLEQPFRGR